MVTPVQTILVIACACLADCRLRGQPLKQPSSSPSEHSQPREVSPNIEADHKPKIKTNDHASEVKIHDDSDAIIFPSDDDDKIYPDVNKINSQILNTIDNTEERNSLGKTPNIHNDESVPVPLIPKVVLAIEAKQVFTNPIIQSDKMEVTFKSKEDKGNIQSSPQLNKDTAESKNISDNTVQTNETINLNNTEVEIKGNDTSNANETAPDFSSRFGVTGNYMLVPVNNQPDQTYQPIQTANAIPVSNIQNPLETYLINNDQGAFNPVMTNVDTNPHYVSKVGSNAGASLQYTSPNSNAGSIIGANTPYIAPNSNTYATTNTNAMSNVNYNSNLAIAPQGNGNYVPINVPNTYVINGQLYAAVTIPNNMEVPNSLYFVNPQVSGYQVANNVPLYKLVSAGQVGQPNQYAAIN